MLKLSPKILCATLVIALALLWLAPAAFNAWQTICLPDNFRLPYANRDNYALYARCVDAAVAKHDIVFLGDSAIWGMYAEADQTLTAHLNSIAESDVCANLAIDGLHYVAMHTLIANYATSLRDRKVLIYLNPLWFNSVKYDLSGDEEFSVNHPRLLPQFAGIQAYQPDFETRVDITLERFIPALPWRSHLQSTLFDNEDLKTYAVEHHDECACERLVSPFEFDTSYEPPEANPDGIPVQHWDFIELETSRQWQSLVSTVRLLQKRGNTVTILIGNINPKLLDDETQKGLIHLRDSAESRLTALDIPFIKLPELAPALYADASHPLSSGYSDYANFLADTVLGTKKK